MLPAEFSGSLDTSGYSMQVDGMGSGVKGQVYALAFSLNDLYVGGRFSMAGENTASSIARWDGTLWHSFSSNGSEGVAADGNPFPSKCVCAGGLIRQCLCGR